MMNLRNFSSVAVVGLLVMAAACKNKQTPPPEPKRPPPMSMAEVQRGHEACDAFHKQACKCATDPNLVATDSQKAELREQCDQASAYPDAIKVALEIARGDGVAARDVIQAYAGVRNIINTCITGTAKLPTLACK